MAASSVTPTAPLEILAGADAFGRELLATLLAHLRTLPSITVTDLGTDKYYAIADQIGRRVAKSPTHTRGLLVCGTGIGVSIFANKFPGVYAATCTSVADAVNSRSINAANVLALSGSNTNPNLAVDILSAFLSTPFKSPCPASSDAPWPDDISAFLDAAPAEMATIGVPNEKCAICCVREGMEFEPVTIMPGGEMRILRKSPTAAMVRFKAGSVEPAHHHKFGHDVVVMKGRKMVWNLSKKESFELKNGDYLYTPGGDVHRVKYFEDTEFFMRWDGEWDILLDEDLAAATAAVEKE